MEKYILCRIENDREYQVMTTSTLESARKQGAYFNDGYVIYETKMVEYGTPKDITSE